jgi:hypothetical protein
MPDQPFATVSTQEIWQELRSHDKLLNRLDQRTTGADKLHEDHEERIRKLEWRYYALLAGLGGGLALAAGIIGRSM